MANTVSVQCLTRLIYEGKLYLPDQVVEVTESVASDLGWPRVQAEAQAKPASPPAKPAKAGRAPLG